MSSEPIQQQIRHSIASLTERGILPPRDGQIVSLLIPFGGGAKDGFSPASKVSIEELPAAIIIAESEGKEECSICLNGYKIGEEVKVMHCTRCYHSGCINKWLGIHGSCPICRYELSVEKETQRQGRGRTLLIQWYRHRPETYGNLMGAPDIQ